MPEYKVLHARVTRCGYGTKVNHQGKKLRRDIQICAKDPKTIKQGSRIYIPQIGKTYTAFDNMYRPSINKHFRRAKRNGRHIDTTIDLYGGKDLGITEIWVYE